MPATYGFLSTYPPTQCGLATFNAALATHLNAAGGGTAWSGCSPSDSASGGIELDRTAPRVVHTWHTDTPGGWAAAANALNRFDVAIIQHEYGIYPGDAGDEVLPLLRALKVPAIVVLHTVLSHPDPLQRSVLERIAAAADAVVTMTDTARQRLTAGYRVDPAQDLGHPARRRQPRPARPREAHDRPHLLTWGLLGPGKGIEWALRALALLQRPRPEPGLHGRRAHPPEGAGAVRRRRTGTRSRRSPPSSAWPDAVRWDDVYLDQATLSRLIRSADVVVLPYDSTEQVTSGVLIEAVGAGVPVVATEFPHAVELLADGPGLLVPHQDPEAMAAAIRHLLAEPGPGRPAHRAGRRPDAALARGGRPLPGPGRPPDRRDRHAPVRRAPVARRERADACGCAAAGRSSPTHPTRTGATSPGSPTTPGLLEHARNAIARREHGYCVDDVSRGLLVACREPQPTALVVGAGRALPGLPHPRAGRRTAFRNRLSYDRRWLDEPSTGDWWGRALWGLGTAAGRCAGAVDPARRPGPRSTVGVRLRSPWPRAMAFAGLGAAEVLRADPRDRDAADLLGDAATVIGLPGPDPEWVWPERGAHLRQPGAGRGGDRGRRPARRRAAARRRACGCSAGCAGCRRTTGTCRPCRSAAGGRACPGTATTSSRSRRPPPPTPAPPRPR